MIMVLCLFVYAMTELRLRRNLQETGETVAGQTKKQIQRPTLKWVFFRFRGVRELRFRAEEAVTVIVTNMTQELWKILRLLGEEYENYYLLAKTCGMWDQHCIGGGRAVAAEPPHLHQRSKRRRGEV